MVLRDEHLDADAELPTALSYVGAHGGLGDVRSLLGAQTLPHAPGGVALLARSAAVGDEDLVDERLDLRRELGADSLRPSALRRDRRVKGLTDGATVDAALA